jgi:hypothetical protein
LKVATTWYWTAVVIFFAVVLFGEPIWGYILLPKKFGFYYCTDKEAYALDGKDDIHTAWWWDDDIMIKYRSKMVETTVGDSNQRAENPGHWQQAKMYVPTHTQLKYRFIEWRKRRAWMKEWERNNPRPSE